MALQRATVLNALFNLVSASSTFATASRRLQFWTETIAMPALFMRYTGEDWKQPQSYGVPQEVVFKVEVWIYVQNGAPDNPPDAAIMPLLDALDTALQANSSFGGRQTLGLDGYVIHAWREGETTIAQGEPANVAIMIVPLSVAVNATLGT